MRTQHLNRWLTALIIAPEQTGVSSKDIIEKLAEGNIEARLVWKPMHLQALIDGTIYMKKEIVCHIKLFEDGLRLPKESNMNLEEQGSVIDIVFLGLLGK